MPHHRNAIRWLRWALLGSVLLSGVKFAAWGLTASSAILSDALESLVNLMAQGFALYSAHLASQPQDENHPYGHGKIEYFAAGFEGALIAMAGLAILAQALRSLLWPQPLGQLDVGLVLVAVGGLGNGLMGWGLLRLGRRYRMLTLQADGRHLLTDALTSLGLLAGLGLMLLTGQWWLDAVLGMLLGAAIVVQGVPLMRKAVRGLMDETDFRLVDDLAQILREHRQPQWMDIHKLRVQRFGSTIHIDCHLTLPWYYDQLQSRNEVTALTHLLQEHLPDPVELFVFTDPCVPASCPSCLLAQCPRRQAAFEQPFDWSARRLMETHKHRLEAPPGGPTAVSPENG